MKRKLISILLATLLTLPMALSAVAATFPDVTEDSFSWALDAVEEMVEDGIIKGYTDGTFKPEKTVSKVESLVLSARILGYTNETFAPYTAFAKEFYADILEKYETPYRGEVAFLLYKDVISEKELSFYIGGDNASAGMKRYEVAKLLTRTMGGESKIDLDASTSEYADSSSIPSDAKPYVRFVTDEGIMNGVGDGKFGPMEDVNRAQIATLLYRIRKSLSETYVYGTAREIDSELGTVSILLADGKEEIITLSDNAIVKQDGYSEPLSRIAPGAEVLATIRGEFASSLDAISHEPDEVFEGAIASLSTTGEKKEIVVQAIDDADIQKNFVISADVTVLYEGRTASLSDLKRAQAVTVHVRDGEAIVIDARESEKTIKGTIESISLEPVLSFSIRLTNGTVETHPVSEKVTAKRNNTAVEASKILVGDKVTITLRYDLIANIVATSSKFTAQGTIEEITIAKLPSLKVRINNAITTFSLSRDCVYTIDGKDGDIYDLRLGANITASVDSETIVSLTSTAPAESSAITGTIENINASYGFFTLATMDGDQTKTMQIFTKRSNLKIINSADGVSKTPRDLKAGMNVSVTGLITNGAFEATTIVIFPN